MLRQPIFAAAIIILSTNFARAQVTGPIPNSGMDDGRYNWNAMPMYYGRSPSPEDSVRAYEIEQKYRETVRTKIPDKKASNDP